MFCYFPTSKEDLLRNGYSFSETTGHYTKKIGDTLENLKLSQNGKYVVAKYFYIERKPENFRDLSYDSLKSISNFITTKSSRILFDIDDVIKIVKIEGNDFCIHFGYSSLKTYYRITYENLKNSDKRKSCIDFLERWKTAYTDTTRRDKIDSALYYIRSRYR